MERFVVTVAPHRERSWEYGDAVVAVEPSDRDRWLVALAKPQDTRVAVYVRRDGTLLDLAAFEWLPALAPRRRPLAVPRHVPVGAGLTVRCGRPPLRDPRTGAITGPSGAVDLALELVDRAPTVDAAAETV